MKSRPAKTSQRPHTAALSGIATISSIAMIIGLQQPAFAYTGDITPAVDVDPDPNIFETTLTADEAIIDIGTGTLASMHAFNGQVPGPEIHVKVGDRVIVHLINNLDTDGIVLHWHGLEINNLSDGTPVTQNSIPPGGGTYTYDFIVPRAGVYWYHPHLKPTDPVWRGLYGPIIVTGNADVTLTELGVLPSLAKTLVLSDVTQCVDVDPGDAPLIKAACVGKPDGFIPKVQPVFDCAVNGGCLVREGENVLSNGRVVQPGDSITVPQGEGLRLRVINSAIIRFFRLVPPPGHVLYRVGGEGGLLDNVRLEGVGSLGALDPGYALGEILLAPADRADIVIVPTGSPGTQHLIQSDLNTPDPNDGYPYNRGAGLNPNLDVGPVVRITVGPPGTPFAIANGDPLLVHPAVKAPRVNLRNIPASDLSHLLDPATLFPPQLGSDNPAIQFIAGVVDPDFPNDGIGPTIDGVRGKFDEAGEGDFTDIPHVKSSRYAFVDDVLELSIENVTTTDHPYHLHGFSIQPIRLTDGVNTYNYGREFLDNINIKVGHKLTFRVRLDDRPNFAQPRFTGGGAAGRWLFHCHIFTHASLGMITELVVLPSSPLDVFIIADLTGSFIDDLAEFKADAGHVIETLSATSPDIRFGLATFEDFPISPFGLPTDVAYERIFDLDEYDTQNPADVAAMLAVINGLSISGEDAGGDFPESQMEALYQAATGDGLIVPCCGGAANITDGQKATFRDEAQKLFLLWTDATFHTTGDAGDIPYPGHSMQQAVDAVLALDPPKVLGISSGGGGFSQLSVVARSTNALATRLGLDCNGDGRIDIGPGQPLVCQTPADGSGVGEAIIRLVRGAGLSSTPTARCQDVVVTANVGECEADASIDDGSFDPDGDPITLEQTPAGPYALGKTPVTLKVTDSTGLSDTCAASVRVVSPGLTIGGAIYTDCGAPLTSGEDRIPVTVSGPNGVFDTLTSGPSGTWFVTGVPCGEYTVTPHMVFREYCHVNIGGDCPPEPCEHSTVITVDPAHEEENLSIQFLGMDDCIPNDMNYDQICTIVFDTDLFVQCVYDGDCVGPNGEDLICPADCNCDDLATIVFDANCFRHDVYDKGVCGSCSGDDRNAAREQRASSRRGSDGGLTVGGAVYEDAAHPLVSGIEGIKIQLLGAERKVVATAVTNGPSGIWRVDDLPDGHYDVVFQREEGRASTGRDVIPIVVNDDNEAANLSIRLLRSPKTTRSRNARQR